MLAKGSVQWILISIILTVVIAYLSSFYFGIGIIGVAVTLFLIIFFRDPVRDPEGDGMLSPADGKVMKVEKGKIGIFMNLHNVHVNRTPLSGRVKGVQYIKGAFRPAFKKESDYNERNIIYLSTDQGDLEIVQIAGSFARRIVCYVREGDDITMGERIGMIRFGSRVDVTIPEGFDLIVKNGDRVRAGESVIAVKE
ncbi:MAG: phosphatidylserine decarboxylase [Halobacteriota archaeon]|nr:phosphatidylserine decarboxylase [Halobacteriota archaeon]